MDSDTTNDEPICTVPRFKMQGFRSVKNDPPPNGQLCIVYFPLGKNMHTGETMGPAAIAFRFGEGWKMADIPTPLRGVLGMAGPAYWKAFSINE